MEDPIWLAKAKSHIGLRETPGPANNPIIIQWADELRRGAIHDDATAWCATFTGAMLKESHLAVPTNPFSARAYLDLPKHLDKPAVGALAIFWRGSKSGWEGHIGVIAGKDQHGNLMIVSGNHGDAVTCSPYDTSRLLGYRWPSISPLPERFNLPLINSDGKTAASEA